MLSIRPNRAVDLKPVNANLHWSEAIERIPGVISFDGDTLPYLVSILSRFESDDHYLTCPAYHAFTGRHGLWGYAKGRSLLLFARHPNDPKKIIFYPQFGNAFPNLALDLLKVLDLPGFQYMFARYPVEQAEFMSASMNRASENYRFEAVTEDVLDWTYPVYTLSTKDVVEAKGKHFKNFRYDIHCINEKEIEIKPIDAMNDVEELKNVIDIWAKGKSKIEYRETLDCYMHLVSLLQNPALNMDGLKFYRNGVLVAYEVWSIPCPKKRVANNLAGMNINAHEGLQGFSSYQYYTVCKKLLEQGIDLVCIGGSETAGLDHFKRKMKPAQSKILKSIQVTQISKRKLINEQRI